MSLKCINLTEEDQRRAWENAKEAVEQSVDGDVRDGDVVRELARAYTGWEGSDP